MDKNSDQIILYGTAWCPDCRRAKQFFGEHRIQYQYIDIDEQPEYVSFVEEVNNGMRSIPTIIFPDGGLLVEPSNAELAEKLNLQTRAERSFYDVIIIGGGPTGLSAAIYTSREGLETLVIERAALGGQAGITQVLDNFPGFDEGISGEDFARRLANQARRFGAELLEASDVKSVNGNGQYLCVATGDGQEYGAKAVLVATGSKYRELGVPGESDLIGSNVHFCATCDGAFYKGKDVLVIGGGNSGFEEGLFLTKFANSVKIVEFEPVPRASAILQEKVSHREDITVVTNHAVQELKVSEGNKLAGVLVKNRATDEIIEWNPDGVFVFVGLTPNTSFLSDAVARDQWGFITTEHNLMSSMSGVFAAGDVRANSTKQAAAAAGEGVTAALMIRQYLQSLGEVRPFIADGV